MCGRSAWLIVRPVSTSKWIFRIASSTGERREVRYSLSAWYRYLGRAWHSTRRKSLWKVRCQRGLVIVFNKIKWTYIICIVYSILCERTKVLILLQSPVLKDSPLPICQVTILKQTRVNFTATAYKTVD